jgi:hypothetical protein
LKPIAYRNIPEEHLKHINPISVMTQLNLAAVIFGTVISGYDVKGAFLNTPMEPGKRMFIRVNPDVVKYRIARYPERKHLIHKDGCLYFKLKRYVYGLQEASHQFNSLLDKKIRKLGFMQEDRWLFVHQEDR